MQLTFYKQHPSPYNTPTTIENKTPFAMLNT